MLHSAMVQVKTLENAIYLCFVRTLRQFNPFSSAVYQSVISSPCLASYRFYFTRLMNSMKHGYSCKIFYKPNSEMVTYLQVSRIWQFVAHLELYCSAEMLSLLLPFQIELWPPLPTG